jgi:cytidylate kinase
LWIVAGPNGSGKTSIYQDADIEEFGGSVWIINPDALAARIRNVEKLSAEDANLEAVKRIQTWLEASVRAHQTVGVETVLSTPKYRELVLAAKSRGFEIRLIYVLLKSAELQMERIRLRVAKGGHDVPVDKIVGRRGRSLAQLPWFLNQADWAWIYDNSGIRPRLIGTKSEGAISLDTEILAEVLGAVEMLRTGLGKAEIAPSPSETSSAQGMIIALDGPAASGKGTLGKRLAAHFGLRHLDTGLLYRAVAKAVLDRGRRLDDAPAAVAAARALDPAGFDEKTLKGHTIGEAASLVSAISEVRTALLAFQREFGRALPGAVLDGRDIGTVIFPDAEVKILVTATPQERARRRALELAATGAKVNEAEILADILRRDERDMTRPVAPLKAAPDAHLLDTTHLDIDAAFRAAVEIVEAVRAGRKRG